jgi:hypothetical protein
MTFESIHICKSCASTNTGKFVSEVGIHFKGVDGLNKPIVFVFPELVVCLTCGHANFTIPETELKVLTTNTPVENAAVVLSSSGASNKRFKSRGEVKPVPTTTDETITVKHGAKRPR